MALLSPDGTCIDCGVDRSMTTTDCLACERRRRKNASTRARRGRPVKPLEMTAEQLHELVSLTDKTATRGAAYAALSSEDGTLSASARRAADDAVEAARALAGLLQPLLPELPPVLRSRGPNLPAPTPVGEALFADQREQLRSRIEAAGYVIIDADTTGPNSGLREDEVFRFIDTLDYSSSLVSGSDATDARGTNTGFADLAFVTLDATPCWLAVVLMGTSTPLVGIYADRPRAEDALQAAMDQVARRDATQWAPSVDPWPAPSLAEEPPSVP